jgi:hypothetical protein
MLNPKPIADFIKDFFKTDKSMRRFMRVMIGVFVFFLIVYPAFHHMYRCYWGLNSTLFWGADVCQECKQVTIDSITKHDTITVYKTIPAPHATSKPGLTQTNKNGDNNQSTVDGNGNHVVTGNGNNVGVNGDVNGLKQRVLTMDILKEIVSHIPTKSTPILIYFQRDKESEVYASQIITTLQQNGFTNIDNTGWGDPNCFDSVKYEMRPDGKLWIFICPESNVSQ